MSHKHSPRHSFTGPGSFTYNTAKKTENPICSTIKLKTTNREIAKQLPTATNGINCVLLLLKRELESVCCHAEVLFVSLQTKWCLGYMLILCNRSIPRIYLLTDLILTDLIMNKASDHE